MKYQGSLLFEPRLQAFCCSVSRPKCSKISFQFSILFCFGQQWYEIYIYG